MSERMRHILLTIFIGLTVNVPLRLSAQEANDPPLLRQDINDREDRVIGAMVEGAENIEEGVAAAAKDELRRDVGPLSEALGARKPTAVPDDSLQAIEEEIDKLEKR